MVYNSPEGFQFLLREDNSRRPLNFGKLHAADKLLTYALSCPGWDALPMLASRVLKDLHDHFATHTAEENKNRLLHRIIAGDDHENRFKLSKVPIAVWETLAKDPAFAGRVGRSQCP